MRNKNYNIQLNLTGVIISVNIDAPNLQVALERSKDINIGKDILQDGVEWIDGDGEVTGIY